LSISFNTPDCLIVTIGTVCENQDTSVRMSLCWLTIAQIKRGVTRFNFSAFGGMKGGKSETRPPDGARWPGEL
ncbi:hypothetical protein ACK37D_17720, partial [Aeromonas veronii]